MQAITLWAQGRSTGAGRESGASNLPGSMNLRTTNEGKADWRLGKKRNRETRRRHGIRKTRTRVWDGAKREKVKNAGIKGSE